MSTLKCEASGRLNGRWPVQGVTDNARRITVGGDPSHKPCGLLYICHCAPNLAVYFIEDWVYDFAGCRPNVADGPMCQFVDIWICLLFSSQLTNPYIVELVDFV